MKQQNVELDYLEDVEELDQENDFEDDDDDDDGVGAKLKKLKGKLDVLAVACFAIGLIGIISIICGIFVNRSYDPKDYYGTYYGVDDYTYYTYHIDEDESYVIISNGTSIGKQTQTFTKCKFVTADKVAEMSSNSDSGDYEYALLLYISDDQAHILWVKDDSPYMFELNANGVILTQETFDFAADMKDPKDYYTTYQYNPSNYVIFNADGTARFMLNGDMEEYQYVFVNKAWGTKWLKNFESDSGLILFRDGENDIHTFFYHNDKLDYGGNIFNRVGSSSGSSGSGDSSGTGTGSGSGTGTGSGSGAVSNAPDWSVVLDYSNVTIETTRSNGYITNKMTYYRDEYTGQHKFKMVASAGSETSTATYYTNGYNSYAVIDGSTTSATNSEVMYYCNDFTDRIDSIDVDSLVETAENVYSDGTATIYLNSNGTVQKISFTSYGTLKFSEHGTTTVTAP